MSALRLRALKPWIPLWKRNIPQYPLYVKGNPQLRIHLPLFWMRMVPSKNRLPIGSYNFEVHPQMTKDDVKQYLEKIYKLDVRNVRITNKPGEVIRSGSAGQYPIRRESDAKFAIVAIRGEESFEMPKLDFFLDKDTEEKEADGDEKPEKEEKSLSKQYKQIQKLAKEDRKKNWLKQDIPSWFQS